MPPGLNNCFINEEEREAVVPVIPCLHPATFSCLKPVWPLMWKVGWRLDRNRQTQAFIKHKIIQFKHPNLRSETSRQIGISQVVVGGCWSLIVLIPTYDFLCCVSSFGQICVLTFIMMSKPMKFSFDSSFWFLRWQKPVFLGRNTLGWAC